MNNKPERLDIEKMSKAVKEFVKERAKRAGSSVVYKEHNIIVKEDPRTGIKTSIPTK